MRNHMAGADNIQSNTAAFPTSQFNSRKALSVAPHVQDRINAATVGMQYLQQETSGP
jgi:hypothetical protein